MQVHTSGEIHVKEAVNEKFSHKQVTKMLMDNFWQYSHSLNQIIDRLRKRVR